MSDLNSGDMYVFHIQANALSHVLFGTMTFINVFIWFVAYPLQQKFDVNGEEARKKKISKQFNVRNWYSVNLLGQLNVCWSQIVGAQKPNDVATYVALFVSALAMMVMTHASTCMSIDVILVEKRALAKKWIYKYTTGIFVVLYMIIIGVAIGVSPTASALIAYVFVLLSNIVFVVALFMLLSKLKQCNDYKEGASGQLIFLIMGEILSVGVTMGYPLAATGIFSWILSLAGVGHYTTTTILLESGLVTVMNIVLHAHDNLEKNGDNSDDNNL